MPVSMIEEDEVLYNTLIESASDQTIALANTLFEAAFMLRGKRPCDPTRPPPLYLFQAHSIANSKEMYDDLMLVLKELKAC